MEQRVEELYLVILSRYPTRREKELLRRRIKELPGRQRGRFLNDVVWALINTREFMLYH